MTSAPGDMHVTSTCRLILHWERGSLEVLVTWLVRTHIWFGKLMRHFGGKTLDLGSKLSIEATSCVSPSPFPRRASETEEEVAFQVWHVPIVYRKDFSPGKRRHQATTPNQCLTI